MFLDDYGASTAAEATATGAVDGGGGGAARRRQLMANVAPVTAEAGADGERGGGDGGGGDRVRTDVAMTCKVPPARTASNQGSSFLE